MLTPGPQQIALVLVAVTCDPSTMHMVESVKPAERRMPYASPCPVAVSCDPPLMLRVERVKPPATRMPYPWEPEAVTCDPPLILRVESVKPTPANFTASHLPVPVRLMVEEWTVTVLPPEMQHSSTPLHWAYSGPDVVIVTAHRTFFTFTYFVVEGV